MLFADPSINFGEIAWGRADVEQIKERAVKGAKNPVWIIGHGISRDGVKAPRMTPDLVLKSIESMKEDYGVRPTLLLFDYLQLIPTRVAKDRVQQVTEMPIRLKELAMRVGAPAVAAVQAGRDVDSRQLQIPELNDAQWASSIEQTADKVFSLWRPCQSMDDGALLEIGDQCYTVNNNLMIVRLLKQRGDQGRYTWGMYFNPALMKLAELESSNGDSKRQWPTDF